MNGNDMIRIDDITAADDAAFQSAIDGNAERW